MYWVFNGCQLETAIKYYVERTCVDEDEKRATVNLINECLTSDEFKQERMVRGVVESYER